MKLRWSILLIGVMLLSGCSQSKPEDPRFKPVLNPNPQYFVTYKGFIDPSLKHQVKLTFLTVYNTTNPKCEEVVNDLAGVTAPRERLHYTHVKPNKQGYYQYSVPMDKYKPGYCGWQIVGTNFNDDGSHSRDNFYSGVWYSAKRTKDVVNIKQDVINNQCYKKACRVLPSTHFVIVADKSVPYNKNHIFEINYYQGKNR